MNEAFENRLLFVGCMIWKTRETFRTLFCFNRTCGFWSFCHRWCFDFRPWDRYMLFEIAFGMCLVQSDWFTNQGFCFWLL